MFEPDSVFQKRLYLIELARLEHRRMVHAWHNGRTADDGQPIQRYAARYEWEDLLIKNGLFIERTVKYGLVWPRVCLS